MWERAHVKVRAGTQEHFERGCGESFWRTTYYREEMIVNDSFNAQQGNAEWEASSQTCKRDNSDVEFFVSVVIQDFDFAMKIFWTLSILDH